jgi:class 3 adenylate cyclase
VQNNSLNLEATDVSLCPYSTEAAAKRRSGASRSNNIGLGIGYASGNIQRGNGDSGYTIAPFTDCIGKTINPVRSFWDFLRF